MLHILHLTCRMFLYGMFHQCRHTTNTVLLNISLYANVFSTRQDVSIPPFNIWDDMFLGFFWCDQCKFGCWWNPCFLGCCCDFFLKFVQLCLLVKRMALFIKPGVWFVIKSFSPKRLWSSLWTSFSGSRKPWIMVIIWYISFSLLKRQQFVSCSVNILIPLPLSTRKLH